MKSVIKVTMIAALALFSTGSLMAQDMRGDKLMKQGEGIAKMTAEEKAKKQTEHLKKELDLTADQVSKVEAINLKYAQKKEAERKAATEKMEEKRAGMLEINKEQDAELKAVLTEAQVEKLEMLRTEKRGEKKENKEARRKGRKR